MALMRRLRDAAARGVREPSYLARLLLWTAHQYLPERVITLNTRHGRMSFLSRDQIIGRLLCLNRAFCIVDIDGVAALVARERPNARRGVLIDVGANIGTVCVPLQARQAFAQTLAFEPDPRNFTLLQRNIQQNGLESSVRPFRFALSSADGEATLWRSGFNYGDHRLSGNGLTVDHASSVTVAVRSLDAVLHEHGIGAGDIGLLWIDTQGHEFHVLQGSRSLIAIGTPLLLEFWPEGLSAAGTNPEELLAMLRDHYDRFCVVNAEMTLRPSVELTLENLRLPDGSFTDLLVL
jgi:FkbM family methyltransferase